MNTKQCFNCKERLPIEDFQPDNRKYQVPADKGKCKVCIKCTLKKAIVNLEVFHFCFEANDFITVKFENSIEVINYFKKLQDESKIN
jgi:hypothetical protein